MLSASKFGVDDQFEEVRVRYNNLIKQCHTCLRELRNQDALRRCMERLDFIINESSGKRANSNGRSCGDVQWSNG
jgi:hypothetical protein